MPRPAPTRGNRDDTGIAPPTAGCFVDRAYLSFFFCLRQTVAAVRTACASPTSGEAIRDSRLPIASWNFQPQREKGVSVSQISFYSTAAVESATAVPLPRVPWLDRRELPKLLHGRELWGHSRRAIGVTTAAVSARTGSMESRLPLERVF